MHDPRVGRFFATDPLFKEYPWNSSYAFSENIVINAVELEGLEKEFYFDIVDAQKAQVAALNNGSSHSESMKVYKKTLEDLQPMRRAFKASINAGFKMPFPSGGTARSLINHYTYGEGKTLKLTREQMLEVYPLVTPDGRPVDLSLSTIDFIKAGDLKVGESKEFSKSILVYSGTPGTLGYNYVTVSGTISLNKDTMKKEFNGTVTFDDTFDFNASTHRDWVAEGQTTIGRLFLPGEAFSAQGSLNVKQEVGKPLVDENGVDPRSCPKPQNNGEYSEAKGTASEAGADLKE